MAKPTDAAVRLIPLQIMGLVDWIDGGQMRYASAIMRPADQFDHGR